MAKNKPVRGKGKTQLSKYFQKLNAGDLVAVIKEQSIASTFPETLQGRTGVIESKRGKAYLVRIKDSARKKTYIIEPIHLKKITPIK